MLNSPQVSEDSSLPSRQSSTVSQITPAVTQLPFLHSNSSSVHLSPKTNWIEVNDPLEHGIICGRYKLHLEVVIL